jgi:hypothetical protein
MTKLERLRTWIEQNGYDGDSLSRALGYAVNMAEAILTEKHQLGISFIWRFNRTFGRELTQQLFDTSFTGQYFVERDITPDQYAAHAAVSAARRNKLLPAATAHVCHGCNKQANQYHHQSYHPDDHLCVVPLCHSCHTKTHRGSLSLTFGVVPTAVGLIRIAVAGA